MFSITDEAMNECPAANEIPQFKTATFDLIPFYSQFALYHDRCTSSVWVPDRESRAAATILAPRVSLVYLMNSWKSLSRSVKLIP